MKGEDKKNNEDRDSRSLPSIIKKALLQKRQNISEQVSVAAIVWSIISPGRLCRQNKSPYPGAFDEEQTATEVVGVYWSA